MTATRRLAIAIVAVAVWATITVWVGILQAGHGSLANLVSAQFNYASSLALLFLLILCTAFR